MATMNLELYKALREGGFEEKHALRVAVAMSTVASIPRKAEVSTLKVHCDNILDRLKRIEAALVEVKKEQVRLREEINSFHEEFNAFHDWAMFIFLPFIVLMTVGMFGILGVVLYQVSK